MKKNIVLFASLFLIFVIKVKAQDTLRNAKLSYKFLTSFSEKKDDISTVENMGEQTFNVVGYLQSEVNGRNFRAELSTKETNPKIMIRDEDLGKTTTLEVSLGKKKARVSYDGSEVGQMQLQQLQFPKVKIQYFDSVFTLNSIKVKKAIITENNGAFTVVVFYATDILLPQLSLMGKQASGLYFLPGTNEIPFLIVKGKATMKEGAVMAIELEKIDLKVLLPKSDFQIPKGYEIVGE